MDNPGFTDINKSQSNGSANGHATPEKTPARPSCLSRLRNMIIHGLEMIFFRVGMTIATHPVQTIILSIIPPLLLSIGIMKFKFNEDFAELLLPPSSRIFDDRAWVREHVPFEQRPIRLILKNENVLSKESILALYDFHTKIEGLQVHGNYTFETMCVRILGQCFVDSLLALWFNHLEPLEKLTDEKIIYEINTVEKNPTYFMDFNATRMLGLIERNSSGHIMKAGVMHADWFIQSSTELRPIAKELEYAAIDLALGGHPAFSLISVFTMDSYAEEFFGGVYGDIILIVYGFPVVLVYIIMALGKPNLTEHGVFLTLAAIVGVILSAGACFGIGLACGFLFGAPHQALIFLLLAVGVDDAFVIITTWTRINKAHMRRPIEERVAITMQHAGVSVTVTSFSDLVAFACGISTQMPVLKSFCIYCSFGILFLFLMQSTLFPACLTLNQRRIEARRDALVPCIQYSPDYEPIACSQKNSVKAGIKKFFAPLLLSKVGMACVLLATLGVAALMGFSVSSLKKGYELEKSLPADSYTRAFLESQRLFFSAEGPGIQTFCGPMDYHQKLPILDRMCNTYVNSSYVMYGLVGNWIPVYKMYVGLFHPFKPKNEDGIPEDEDEFYITVKKFFESPLGIPFSKYIEFTDDTVPRISWSYFPMQQIVSTDVWENEHIMEVVRGIADDTTKELGGGKCFCYSVFHIFTEVIRYVDTEIMRNFLLAGVAIFLVTLLLIVDIVTSLFVLVCVCLTTLDIMGTLELWGFYLDVNMVVLLIISIGLAVDFSAHIGYTFMTLTGTRKERATHTIEQIGPAILHGAVTTFLVFFVLIFGRSLNQFFAVFILVVVYGLWHGLCFLPVVLSLLGPEPYYNAGPVGTLTSAFPPTLDQDMPKKSDNDSVWIDEPTIIPPTEDVESKDSQVTTKSSFGLDSSNIRYGAMDGGSEEAPAVNNDVTSVAKEVQNTDL
ncbi:patched domain-containing protein 3-like isoform X1 [Mya arenaria]|uniref:patched domain-containing protein 3-like isoform X1 n=1 Tax=Mya arenaria TaxID=6604 RepID=UPI0022E98122|nr:patched domain-containing protein 3-like isoform X1 [Mya arenaria]XP_052790877.1 patched domain-containing protein 3-like isoform X1 [Mya arenaria]XP_052790878.1 patched domain-containing protein 3-like isoform X1 [Mya arenaria]